MPWIIGSPPSFAPKKKRELELWSLWLGRNCLLSFLCIMWWNRTSLRSGIMWRRVGSGTPLGGRREHTMFRLLSVWCNRLVYVLCLLMSRRKRLSRFPHFRNENEKKRRGLFREWVTLFGDVRVWRRHCGFHCFVIVVLDCVIYHWRKIYHQSQILTISRKLNQEIENSHVAGV